MVRMPATVVHRRQTARQTPAVCDVRDSAAAAVLAADIDNPPLKLLLAR
jgi:hypothetical protein